MKVPIKIIFDNKLPYHTFVPLHDYILFTLAKIFKQVKYKPHVKTIIYDFHK